ncbi:hypothetical protein GCM10023196_085290 [Actinoallomurus vinaceus]|uniref:Flavin reductase like domain-containing protein n=1 Tax=Actinoallomurus vinaceus TaxID=1080074 RepID=A0ABP8UNA5_9ACTN
MTALVTVQRGLGRSAAAGPAEPPIADRREPHHRGSRSGALVIEGGAAALECEARQQVTAGDHMLFIAEVLAVDYVDADRPPLIRVNRRYR